LLDVDSNVTFLKVSLEPDPAIAKGGQQGVRFIVEVPPGSPPLARPAFDPVRVNIRTNHPQLLEIAFDVAFVSG